MSKTIVHILHDGNEFPEDLIGDIIISYDKLMSYHKMMSDKDISLLVKDIDNIEMIKFPISRLLCDVERFIDDTEVMDKYGMGFAYSHVYNGEQIRILNKEVKDKVLIHYNDHHKRLDNAILSTNEHIYFIDLHSFNIDATLPSLIDRNTEFPDICIGYDKGHCNKDILENVFNIFKELGYFAAFNYPYRGSLIPNVLFNKETPNTYDSFMIEINSTVT